MKETSPIRMGLPSKLDVTGDCDRVVLVIARARLYEVIIANFTSSDKY